MNPIGDVAHMVRDSSSAYLRQGKVTAKYSNPPSVDVEINCEGTFTKLVIASGTTPSVGDTVWVMQQNNRYVVMGVQQNTVPTPSTDDVVLQPQVSGGTQSGPTIFYADIRSSTMRYSDLIQPRLVDAIGEGGVFTDATFINPKISDLDISVLEGLEITAPVLIGPQLRQPNIQSPQLDGGAEVVASGSIRSGNYVPGSAGWAISGQGVAEFNDIIVRNSGMIGGVALGLTDVDGIVDGGSIASQSYVPGSTGWAIDGDGNAEFNSVVVRGEVGTGGALSSSNYVAGVSGWAIDGDGDAEFNSATVRGDLITGPDGAGITEASIVPYGGGGPYQGTKWGGPDPLGTGVQGGITQYTDAATAGINWAAYTELRQDILTIEARSYMEVIGNIDLYGNLTMPGPGNRTIFTDSDLVLDCFSGDVQIASGSDLQIATGDVFCRGGVVKLGTGAGMPGGWTGWEGVFHADNSSGYLIMGNGTDTLIGADNSVIIRPGGNGGGEASFTVTGGNSRLTVGLINNTARLDINHAGIAYPGTNGTGSANSIGFKWSSPSIYGRVDNAVGMVVGTASDRRLKGEIEQLDGGESLRRLLALNPIDFQPLPFGDYDEPQPHRRPGLIADEVELLERWAVPETESGEFQTVDYLGLIPVIISAIQHLSDHLPRTKDEPRYTTKEYK